MPLHISAYDIGCEPSPSVPAETLLQDGWATFLLFFAVSKSIGASGHLDDLGVAVLECVGCAATKFGYPNDEGLPEHPLYGSGLSGASSAVSEIAGSDWAKEVAEQMCQSASRIWGGRETPQTTSSATSLRHFVITLKGLTFECLASSLVVKSYAADFPSAFSYVQSRFNEH
jgi:hypothetical protein